MLTCYGWTIDYINENVTIPQILQLIKMIKQYPPVNMMTYGMGEKTSENKLMEQLNELGDNVGYDKFLGKDSIKSVIRLRDKVKIK